MKVRCDKCRIDFSAYLREEEKQTEHGLVIRTYMQCPNCREKYDISYDTNETIALKKKIRKLSCYPMIDPESESELWRRQRKLERMKRQVSEKMEQAKGNYYREKEKEENG